MDEASQGGLVICLRAQLLGVLCGLESSGPGWKHGGGLITCGGTFSLGRGSPCVSSLSQQTGSSPGQALGIISKECLAVVMWGGWPEKVELVT